MIVHPADLQDRDGAEPLLRQARRLFPFLERIIGDAGYQGPKMAAAVARSGRWTIEIVRRCDKHEFVALPKRWIIERTSARRIPKQASAPALWGISWGMKPTARNNLKINALRAGSGVPYPIIHAS